MHAGCSPKKRDFDVNASPNDDDDVQTTKKRFRRNNESETMQPGGGGTSETQSSFSHHNARLEFPDTQMAPQQVSSVSGTMTNENAKRLENSERRLREIINSEFQKEISAKQNQLQQIDERLTEAWRLLDRLRYAIVADYYKKQELNLAENDAATLFGNTTNFLEKQRESLQKPLHPSLKKIIGKRPHNLQDLIRDCPKRVAAKNAKHTLYTRTTAQLREERRRQKIIKEKGIVIDHSKQAPNSDPAANSIVVKTEETEIEMPSTSASSLRNLQRSLNEQAKKTSERKEHARNALNATRFNNKTSHLFVIGNTSKYIGPPITKDEIKKSQMASTASGLTHKWLVYVQLKDKIQPIETFLKKVRFFLHPSYRPNDIVDVSTPPFQILRRGWGDFPMRLQFFFHEIYHQKPVQLIHKIVLDKTMSGRETLGSETIVEIWLRDRMSSSQGANKTPLLKSPTLPCGALTHSTSPRTPTGKKTKTHSNSLSSHHMKEAIDDNLFEFLNKIEESRTSLCADIEKIQPTVLVNEPLSNISTQCSPVKRSPLDLLYRRQPLKSQSEAASSPLSQHNSFLQRNNERSVSAMRDLTKDILRLAEQTTNATASDDAKTSCDSDYSTTISHSPIKSNNSNSNNNSHSNNNNNNNNDNNSNNNSDSNSNSHNNIINKEENGMKNSLKVFNQSSGTVILPFVRPDATISPQIPNSPKTTNQDSQMSSGFQKKLVRLVDANGKVKCVQMLVSNNAKQRHSSEEDSIQQSSSSSGGLTSSNTRMPNKSKNFVFQREGKIYIIDPLQSRLKQEQKHQVSLLKPQVSLLKPQVKTKTPQAQQQQQQQQRQRNTAEEALLRSVISDHDYAAPARDLIWPSWNVEESLTVSDNLPVPQIHFGLSDRRMALNNSFKEMRLTRISFQRVFQKVNFQNIRSAVEFLLRKLPLVTGEDEPTSTANAFPFTCRTLEAFQNLPAFKQRSHEWLRAKYIARILRFQKSLKALNVANPQVHTFWSTHEVATFARYHAFTPSMKALLIKQESPKTLSGNDERDEFAALVKSELKSEQTQLVYDTLSNASSINTWTEQMCQEVKQYDKGLLDNEVIEIMDDDDDAHAKHKSKSLPPAMQSQSKRTSFYLRAPTHLENAIDLVTDACKDVGCSLEPEQIVPDVRFSAAQVVLASSMQCFVERLLREGVALALQEQMQSNSHHQQKSNAQLPQNMLKDVVLSPQILRKVVMNNPEYDFLTNAHFGVESLCDTTLLIEPKTENSDGVC